MMLAAMIITKKYGSCGNDSSSTAYLAISFAPDKAVVMMPSGFMKNTAMHPTMTPMPMANAVIAASFN